MPAPGPADGLPTAHFPTVGTDGILTRRAKNMHGCLSVRLATGGCGTVTSAIMTADDVPLTAVSDRTGGDAAPADGSAGLIAALATPKTRAGEANVERILDAALEIFAAYGLRGARVEEIAARAGLSKTNLLYYFRTKDALYRAVLERTLDMWLEPLRALDASREPIAALSDYIRRKLAYSRSHPQASRLFATEILQGGAALMPVLEGPLAELVDAKVALLQRWIDEKRLAPVDPRHLIFAIWATTQHYADFAVQIRALTGRDLSDDGLHREAGDAVVALLVEGLRPRR